MEIYIYAYPFVHICVHGMYANAHILTVEEVGNLEAYTKYFVLFFTHLDQILEVR